MVELLEFIFELLGEIIKGLISNVVLSTVLGAVLTMVGFCYLHLRWRRRAIVHRVLTKQYEGSYANAGLVVSLRMVAATGIALMLSLFAALTWSLVKVR